MAHKKTILASLLVALGSQISIGLHGSNFIVSAGIIFFVVLLYFYKELQPIPTGILSGIMVYLLRLVVHYVATGNLKDVLFSYQLEILFYIFYAIIYSILIQKHYRDHLNFIFFAMILSDLSANIIEVLVRNLVAFSPPLSEVGFTLLLVSIVRSTIVWLVLRLFKHYRMFLMKEEHEIRYKKLLWFTSQLKSEMYWIEKNMDHIESVMSESYTLFEKINLGKDTEEWSKLALNIARNIHEIKKENGLVIRGIKEITENELKDRGMDFTDIVSLLAETMKREVKRLNKKIEFEFDLGTDFYTSKHYSIMSMLRNLIMNSMDAIPDTQKDAKITVLHVCDGKEHYFEVSDNGVGMDEESLSLIFSPGFSTKINYNTGEINRGLGLSIVQYIAEEQLGGTVSVASSLGQGTSFRIHIPKTLLEEVK